MICGGDYFEYSDFVNWERAARCCPRVKLEKGELR